MRISSLLTVIFIIQLALAGPAFAQVDLLIAEANIDESATEVILVEPGESVEMSTALPELNLSEAIERALSDNHTLQMARQAVELARAGNRSALAAFLPDLSTSYVYTRLAEANVISVPDVGEYVLQPANSFFWGLTLSYPLYSGGQDTATERAGEAETVAAEYRADQAEALIRLGVTSAYTAILEIQAALDSARKSLEHLDEVLRTSQALFDQGYLPMSDLLAVRVARSRAEQAVAELERAVEIAQSALAVLIGGEVGNRWTLAPVEYPESEVPYTLEVLWDWALASRPEIQEIAAQREAVEAQMDAIRSTRGPRVDLQAQYSRTGGSVFPDDSTVLLGTVSIWWDLYDFGRTEDLLAPLEEQLGLLDIRQAELEARVQQEVESSLLGVQTRLGNLQVSREAVLQAREAFRVSQRRMDEGLGLTLEVLDAEATLAETSAGYNHTLYEYFRGLATLAQTVGLTTDDLVALISANMEDQ